MVVREQLHPDPARAGGHAAAKGPLHPGAVIGAELAGRERRTDVGAIAVEEWIFSSPVSDWNSLAAQTAGVEGRVAVQLDGGEALGDSRSCKTALTQISSSYIKTDEAWYYLCDLFSCRREPLLLVGILTCRWRCIVSAQ